MSDKVHLPSAADRLAASFPDLWDAYSDLGQTCAQAGPLPAEIQRYVKLALAVASRSEGAVHSHAARALAEGISADALRHVAILAIPTIGFPAAVAALTWIEDISANGRD